MRAMKTVGKKRDGGKVVLVGTYRGDQLTKWRGWYCWPVEKREETAGQETQDARRALGRSSHVPCLTSGLQLVNELWLFNGTKDERRYRAEFIGVKTREELIRDYGYPVGSRVPRDRAGRAGAPRTPKPHATHYALFKTELLYRHKLDVPQDAEQVIIRLSDFAKRSPKIAKQLKAYLESPNRRDPDLAKRLPEVITKLRPAQLRVCEAAVQCDFISLIYPGDEMPYKQTGKHNYRIASLFAGCGGLDLGFIGGFDFLGERFARNRFDVVWANELNPNACRTYERNLGPHIVCGDIKEKISEIPADVDVVMGGFPCQDISINGKMLGISGKRSSLYSYIVEAVKRCRPKVFVAENVGSLMLKQHEHSFKTILADFEALDYNVTYKVYHAEEYGVPQTRERIIFVGTRKDIPCAA